MNLALVADVLRIALVFIPGAAVLAITGVIIVRYYQAYRFAARAAAEAGRSFDWWGLLPRHVWQIGVSYLMLAAAGVWHAAADIHRTLHGHVFYIGFALVLGGFALWDLLGHQRKVRETHRRPSKTSRPPRH